VLLDGATGTELERRGIDIALPLWSTRALLDAPETLADVHRDYLRAGADAVTAATFRTHRRTLAREGLAGEAAALTAQAVAIARTARDEVRPAAIVLGSVAPLEDCYRPDLAPAQAACRSEHADIVGSLVEAGADAILIETMNTLREATAALDAAIEAAPRVLLSVTAGEPGRLLSGEPLEPLIDRAGVLEAIGVNCVSAAAVEGHVRWLAARVPPGVRVLAYANVGRADAAGNWISTDAVAPPRYADYAMAWIRAGATIVGGCCGTGPATIEAIAARIAAHMDPS
jgi:S-methylmethionine-dependent homocysteine/selenocysteine methylase